MSKRRFFNKKSKKNRTIKIIFIVLFFLAISLYGFYLIYEKSSYAKLEKTNYKLSKDEIALIQDGDIILRHGYGMVSDMIVETFNKDLGVSHCALITKDKNDDKFIVVHSVSQSLSDYDGVQWQYLNNFVRDSKENSVIVLRYKKDKDSHTKIGKRALYYLEKQVPFDSEFLLDDSSSFYCTELLWKVFLDEFDQDIFYNIQDHNYYDPLTFDLFMDTNNFEVVFNHNISEK